LKDCTASDDRLRDTRRTGGEIRNAGKGFEAFANGEKMESAAIGAAESMLRLCFLLDSLMAQQEIDIEGVFDDVVEREDSGSWMGDPVRDEEREPARS